jgi:uncharacterized protein
MPKSIRQTIHREQWSGRGREIVLEFRQESKPAVPAILQLPIRTSAVPGVLILHGFSSRKEVLAGTVGTALLQKGLASLSIDLPLHGTRHDPVAAQALRNPLRALRHWRQALAEASLGVRYLQARPEIDRDRIAIVGYSLGSQLAVAVAAGDPAVRAVVVAAGGDLPDGSPLTTIARSIADPLRAVRGLGGRPLLMVHGTRDRTVSPAQAKRLFDAAREPKEIRWVDAGHRLPVEAVDAAVDWLADRLV